MRDHSHHVEYSRSEAVTCALEASGFNNRRPAVEQVDIAESFGRILARDVRSQVDKPSCLTCAMDSIAVHWDDFATGLPDTSTWVRGVDWEFANTGVAMPEGFDTAIVIEHVTVSEDLQHVSVACAPSKRFAGTRAAASELKRQESVIATAGTLITPDVAARIASGNHAHVPVLAKPRVAFIPTGNELVRPGLPWAPERAFAGYGKTIETNSLLVQGKVEGWGGTFVGFDIVPDNPAAISDAIRMACAQADIVVLNAGSSKGSDDWSVEQMEELGHVYYHETNHGPGHHSSFALVDDTPVVGISGPAGGASFTLDFYLRPLMRAFLGQDPSPATVRATLTEAFPAKHKHHGAPAGEDRPSVVDDEREFFGVKAVMLTTDDAGRNLATPVKGRMGSAQTAHANAMYLLSNKPDKIPAPGDVIEVELR